MSTPNRNEPCPCGSGKKYKKCCLGKIEFARVDPSSRTVPDITKTYSRALSLHSVGRIVEAAAGYREVLTYQPRHADALHMLGVIELQCGRHEEALRWIDEALKVDPRHVFAYYNRGIVLQGLKRPEEALASYDRALELKPDYAEAHSNRGIVLRDLNRHEEAMANYRRALALKPGHTEAHNNLGNVFLFQGRTEEAIACYDRALAIQPDYHLAYYNKVFALNYLSSMTPHAIYEAHRGYAERFETPLRAVWPMHSNNCDPGRRLKIGYVSPDFRMHSVAFFVEPILAHHDKTQIEVYGYYNHSVRDEVTERLMRYADHWIPCKDLTDEQLAARIHADGIDILVDLAGHTRDNRLLVFARKPAPVQVTYLGYVATTGLSAMDYRFSHIDTDPEGNEAFNSERLYRLPRSLWCYRPPADMPAVEPQTPAHNVGYITFGSMNNIAKVSEASVTLWARLLRAIPRAQLIMAGVPQGMAQRRIHERFAAQDIEAGRVVLVDKLPLRQFRELHHQIDIALDPFPHNGNTTTCDSLWMGVPVISLVGQAFVSRFGYHLLKTIGLEELAAQDENEYVHIAVELAQDLERLSALRAGMRARMQASALRDEAGMARDVEAAYRAMWQAWCRAHTGAPS